MRKQWFSALSLAAAAAFTVPLAAQQPAPAPPPPAPPAATPLGVGVEAPDFTLPASTKEGVSAKPVHLKDLRGKTVVLAFFYQARTKG
jgi:cytochrome oxidase Cu insertion factor (SCO1/SenC/PrrC family)